MTIESISEREEQEIQEAVAALLGGHGISGEQDIPRDFDISLEECFPHSNFLPPGSER